MPTKTRVNLSFIMERTSDSVPDPRMVRLYAPVYSASPGRMRAGTLMSDSGNGDIEVGDIDRIHYCAESDSSLRQFKMSATIYEDVTIKDIHAFKLTVPGTQPVMRLSRVEFTHNKDKTIPDF
jgi:hypothetical protein